MPQSSCDRERKLADAPPSARPGIAKWSKLRSLAWRDRRTLLTAMLLLPLIAILLRLRGLSCVHEIVSSRRRDSTKTGMSPAGTWALVAAAANHGPFRFSCLTRSLTLAWLLARQGIKCELRIGVQLVDGCLDAHAWVECDGRPVNDRPDVADRYAPFDGLPPPAAFPSR